MTRSLWSHAGGYPEWLSDAGEDTLFDIRAKAQPSHWAFVPEARVHWRPPDTLKKLIKTYYRYSLGDGEARISPWFGLASELALRSLAALPIARPPAPACRTLPANQSQGLLVKRIFSSR